MRYIKYVVLLNLFVSSLALASAGNTILPHFLSNKASAYTTTVYLTNITEENIDVTIQLFDESGVLITDDNGMNSGHIRKLGATPTAYSENVAGETVTLTIAPRATFTLSIQPTLNEIGHGVITWQQDSNAVKGLVGQAKTYRVLSGREMMHAITINAGLPF